MAGGNITSLAPVSAYDCVVIDDDPDICRLISHVLSGIGVSSLGLHSAGALEDALMSARPSVVFLDIALGRWDAIDGIRILGQTRFDGAVQLISGRDRDLVEAVRAVGERHGLKMLEPLQKPFRSEHLRRISRPRRSTSQARRRVRTRPRSRPSAARDRPASISERLSRRTGSTSTISRRSIWSGTTSSARKGSPG